MSGPAFDATVLVPTHSHAETLDLAVGSALSQTTQAVEVIVIGDGVTEDVRVIARELERSHPERVRFLDLPKGPSHGEVHRGRAIDEARSDAVFYLCDDDLLWPDHVASLLALLRHNDLVHSLNGYFTPEQTFVPYFSDLSSAEFRAVLMHPDRNAVSLTGTAHTASAYRRLPVGWETTPQGRWPDHFMWQKFFALPGLRAATSHQVTTLQLPSGLEDRNGWAPGQRRAELQAWSTELATPAGRAVVEASVSHGMNREGADLWARWHAVTDLAADLQTRVDDLTPRLRTAEDERRQLIEDALHAAARYEQLARELDFRSAELAAVTASRTWRLRGRLLRSRVVRFIAGCVLRR